MICFFFLLVITTSASKIIADSEHFVITTWNNDEYAKHVLGISIYDLLCEETTGYKIDCKKINICPQDDAKLIRCLVPINYPGIKLKISKIREVN